MEGFSRRVAANNHQKCLRNDRGSRPSNHQHLLKILNRKGTTPGVLPPTPYPGH